MRALAALLESRFAQAVTIGLASLLCLASPAAAPAPEVVVLELRGAIGPATADYVVRGLQEAERRQAQLSILEMDTPGGLDTSMREIVQAILASSVPVATYVSPAGARAASAGAYILYASHLAAMAPGTNVGAATPVALGGGSPFFGGDEEDGSDAEDSGGEPKDKASAPRTASEAKAVNDAAAYMRSLADLRQRNGDWAEAAVRESASLSAAAAVEKGVADFMAGSLNELLDKAHGRTVTVADRPVTLATRGAAPHRIEPDWRTRLLAVVTDPNVALLLMLIGVYGVVFELINPGSFLPGTVGAIALILGLYALALLPIDYAGLGLIVLGIGLMTAEAFVPSFGALGIGGAVAFALGATILMDVEAPGFTLSYPLVAGLAAFALGFSLLVLRAAFRSRRSAVVTGREEMIGALAEVRDWQSGHGHVLAHGERWQAVSSAPLAPGDKVRIRRLDGLTLHVEPEPGGAPRGEGS